MDSPDLTKLRRFSLMVSLLLTALVIAQVRLKTPVEVSPLGIPLIIARPNLLTVALVIACIYAALRFAYYGMLVQPSPMRARRELPNRIGRYYSKGIDQLAEFDKAVQQDVDKYFPSMGKHKVTFQTMMDAAGAHVAMSVPPVVRALCWIDTIDFLLPVVAPVAAVGLWLTLAFALTPAASAAASSATTPAQSPQYYAAEDLEKDCVSHDIERNGQCFGVIQGVLGAFLYLQDAHSPFAHVLCLPSLSPTMVRDEFLRTFNARRKELTGMLAGAAVADALYEHYPCDLERRRRAEERQQAGEKLLNGPVHATK